MREKGRASAKGPMSGPATRQQKNFGAQKIGATQVNLTKKKSHKDRDGLIKKKENVCAGSGGLDEKVLQQNHLLKRKAISGVMP